jgi:hypothetical protein
MSGHYIKTETNQSGQSSTDDWYFTSCGDGCASVGTAPGGSSVGQARLVSGEWALDANIPVSCDDGRQIANPGTTHYTWDPNSLAGAGAMTYQVQGCYHPAGWTFNTSIQLRQAS